ncbi:nuclease-related domain-containing protein [Tuberibacillus sp. Marseille-P3662]|uniref:nuclease-related domain-containing protein n=1 Tax=Tuberibacillus sp. Marseille-P3662 TaxID=1965358 RepID=UPI001593A8B8|nr:nuclease-related domain-containing protein [Tuberibacillus sp. Marseille-P3662]
MIVKERTEPIRIKLLEALIRRLPENHAKQRSLKEDLTKRKAGYGGELELDYHLRLLPYSWKIFNDLRLTYHNRAFQIDALILTPNFAVIVEAKNLAGNLTYDPTFNQLIQNHNGKVRRISDPFAQVIRQRNLLIKWLEYHNVYSLPFEYLVVNTNPRTILEADSNNQHIAKHFLHVENVPISVKNVTSVYKDPIINARESHQLSTLLVNAYQPASINILEEYGVSKNELLQGVHCPKCEAIPIKRKNRKWYCQKCQSTSKDAHEQAIHDYFYLVKSTITNGECRDFLQLSSRHVAKRLLNSMYLLTRCPHHSWKYCLKK